MTAIPTSNKKEATSRRAQHQADLKRTIDLQREMMEAKLAQEAYILESGGEWEGVKSCLQSNG